MDMGEIPAAIEPTEWFVVFHRTSRSPVLSLLACGEFKHVSAFGYLPGVKRWLLYDVCWRGTRIVVADQPSIIAWTAGCDILKIGQTDQIMAGSSRLGLYCVSAVKHLLRLRCVAATPGGLYRHILRNGGTVIHGQRPAADPSRPEPRGRAAASAE